MDQALTKAGKESYYSIFSHPVVFEPGRVSEWVTPEKWYQKNQKTSGIEIYCDVVIVKTVTVCIKDAAKAKLDKNLW